MLIRLICLFMARVLEDARDCPSDPRGSRAWDLDSLSVPVDEEAAGTVEGRLLTRRHVVRERNRALRQRKLDDVRRGGRPVECEVCGFDFEQTYGERGSGFIECHHTLPLYVTGPRKTRPEDLALLCSNCHRMIHVRPPWLSLAELRALIR